MSWNVYAVGPIDFHWNHLDTVAEAGSKISMFPDRAVGHELESFMGRWESAKQAALNHGWEGDFNGDPRVIWLPYEDGFSCGFVFKQSNNGTTYVVSPVTMAWLDE